MRGRKGGVCVDWRVGFCWLWWRWWWCGIRIVDFALGVRYGVMGMGRGVKSRFWMGGWVGERRRYFCALFTGQVAPTDEEIIWPVDEMLLDTRRLDCYLDIEKAK